MNRLIWIILLSALMLSCNSSIKNEEAEVLVEEGTAINVASENQEVHSVDNKNYIGSWVGYFKNDSENGLSEKELFIDDGFFWSRENKINISIDEIKGDSVNGHSVVAGNDRPFLGVKVADEFKVKEPGDDKYDGEFIFKIIDDKLIGKWMAYKNIDIKKRKYELEKKEFTYDPDIMLIREKAYLDWNIYKKKVISVNISDEMGEWVEKEFASATEQIYKINASTKLLTKAEVENLKRGDLTIIRNTIYARHGYSFKYRPLRVFFDAQDWYIPVHTDIKADFTAIEKENIKLLLRYEKNAVTYYDYFGRG
jgi:hypothetical protein